VTVDFIGYAEASALLLNADLPDVTSLVDHLEGREWLQMRCTDRDCMVLRKFQRELRPVFEAAHRNETARVIKSLNELMSRHPIKPRISDQGTGELHLHVANTSSVAELLIGESLLGLATIMCDLGPNRFGVCSASPCTNVFVDSSPNLSRRYCSERCSSRANVAKFRARQKAGLTAGDTAAPSATTRS
jgi:predicted RNA-binding Zn ribbon-like protein